jgi:hypothetical protein
MSLGTDATQLDITSLPSGDRFGPDLSSVDESITEYLWPDFFEMTAFSRAIWEDDLPFWETFDRWSNDSNKRIIAMYNANHDLVFVKIMHYLTHRELRGSQFYGRVQCANLFDISTNRFVRRDICYKMKKISVVQLAEILVHCNPIKVVRGIYADYMINDLYLGDRHICRHLTTTDCDADPVQEMHRCNLRAPEDHRINEGGFVPYDYLPDERSQHLIMDVIHRFLYDQNGRSESVPRLTLLQYQYPINIEYHFAEHEDYTCRSCNSNRCLWTANVRNVVADIHFLYGRDESADVNFEKKLHDIIIQNNLWQSCAN